MALHVYGVVAASAVLPADAEGRAAPLQLVTDEDLAAVVDEVEEDRPARPKDLLRHARVLEQIMAEHTVLPMRFAVVLPDEAAVREEVLRHDRDSLRHLLASFDGLVQLTVQVFHEEEPALREVMRREPDLVAERDRLRSLPPVLAQPGQVDLGQAVSTALDMLQEEDRQSVLGRLAPIALAVAENERADALQVVNAAFLVERRRRADFDRAVATIGGDDGTGRLRVRYVGPQPPYAFLEAVRTGELVWV